MTKKTNSVLFRLGVNSLWQFKLSNMLQIFKFIRIETVLYFELIKHSWNILSVKWNGIIILLQVYNTFTLSKIFKRDIFKYYKFVKNIKLLSEKFSLNNIYIQNILKIMKVFHKKKIKNVSLFNFSIFTLFLKRWKLGLVFKILIDASFFSWLPINKILFSCLNKKICKKDYYLSCDIKILVKTKLQKLNGFIYFKILGAVIENIFLINLKKIFVVHFNNIWSNQGWIFRFFKKDKNRFLLKLFFLSCLYNDLKMFLDYISGQLKRNKNHKKLLRLITKTIEIFWKSRRIGLRGIQLRVAGKLNGKMRKSKYHYSIGKVQLQTLTTFLNYDMCISYTKFGIISIKFWILHENK